MLPVSRALYLKAYLQHGLTDFLKRTLDDAPAINPTNEAEQQIELYIAELNPDFINSIKSTSSVCERCLLTARFFGDQDEIRFWTLASHYLQLFSTGSEYRARVLKRLSSTRTLSSTYSAGHKTRSIQGPLDKAGGGEQGQSPSSSLSSSAVRPNSGGIDFIDSAQLLTASRDKLTIPSPNIALSNKLGLRPLPQTHDILREHETVLEEELHRSRIHFDKRNSYASTQQCAQKDILLGKKSRAAQLLLETPVENANYYKDALKACILAASVSQEEFQNTIKLVATNLIASNSLNEGVDLLTIVGQAGDACRYLQFYDDWVKAAWLAKVSLPDDDCADVMQRWADHLVENGKDMQAICVLISLGQFLDALQLLHMKGYVDLASHFAAACEAAGCLEDRFPDDEFKSMLSLPRLLARIRKDYGNYLQKLDFLPAAVHYQQIAAQVIVLFFIFLLSWLMFLY